MIAADEQFTDPWWIWLIVGAVLVAALIAVLFNLRIGDQRDPKRESGSSRR